MAVSPALPIDDALSLLDWKRQVFALYAADPQTPLEAAARGGFEGLSFVPYDPAARVIGTVEPDDGRREELSAGAHAPIGFRRIGRVSCT